MSDDRPSKQVTLQNLRNRVMDDLELAASYDKQRQYQEAVPYINVPTEMVCMWGNDHVAEGWQSWFVLPVFTPDELEAIARFDVVMESVSGLYPGIMPSLAELIGTEAWERLRLTAEESLKVFQRRGRMS